MAEKLGPLLRKWRKLSDLTGTVLAEELRLALETESYSKSDISKWEHGRIPPEDVVEELEEILSAPKGSLLKAAGYRGAAEYRRSVAGEEQERGDEQQGESESLKRQQMEHIRTLQDLARSTVDAVPELPDLDDANDFDVFYSSLAKLFLRLTGDVRWTDLAAHLGEKAQEIKDMSFVLDPYIPPHWRPGLSVPDHYKKSVHRGWELIITSGLQVVANSGDTREWEYNGLNQRCPSCPIQTFEGVDIGP
jgi:transcriptional regulator with XRE-family HTH domain